MQFYTASQLLLCKIVFHGKNNILAYSRLLMIFLVAFNIINEAGLKILEKDLMRKVRFHYGCVIFLKGSGNFCENIY